MTECRWCGKPATTQREVVPADVNKQTKETRHAPSTADVCDEHAAMIDREVRRAELEAAIRRLNSRLARTAIDSPRHAVIVKELGASRLELAELNS